MPAHTLPFDNSYARLPERFYQRQAPERVSAPALIRVNPVLARELGIDPQWLASAEGIEMVAGNRLPDGTDPIATAYAGHQFGGWNPQLGDGRALLLGELIGTDGLRYDVQLKGSGRTPYSRGGDGRAPLGPVLREYLLSEAMATLGIPTSRSLAAVTTGDTVLRDKALPGAVLARVTSSHIRIGTFQFFAARQDTEALRVLVDHVVRRHYPDLAGEGNPALALLDAVVTRQASLIARWQLVGFIHGVMNTDNMLLSGETIDYGPCAFMDAYNPAAVFSSIDHAGRYAYHNQPAIAHWNLVRLAEALLSVLDDDQERAVALAQEVLNTFTDRYDGAYQAGMRRKLGFSESHEDGDQQLVAGLLSLMSEAQLDFTLTFRHLADLADPQGSAGQAVGQLFTVPDSLRAWLPVWRARLQRDPMSGADRQALMYRANPVYIARNHRVEEAITAATERADFGPFHRLLDRLTQAFDYDPAQVRYATPPRPEQVIQQTFCGT
jgi:uncharacterized protein YdiU (UPF0061 family)